MYALVTFRQPLTAQDAGAVVQNIARVNAFEVGFAPVVGIPEPVKGVNRGDSLVHHITLKQMNPLDVRGLEWLPVFIFVQASGKLFKRELTADFFG